MRGYVREISEAVATVGIALNQKNGKTQSKTREEDHSGPPGGLCVAVYQHPYPEESLEGYEQACRKVGRPERQEAETENVYFKGIYRQQLGDCRENKHRAYKGARYVFPVLQTRM